MLMSDKCFERVLFDYCDKLATGLNEKKANTEYPDEYHAIAFAIHRICSDGLTDVGCKIEKLCSGEDIYELEILDSDEESTLFTTREEAEAQAQKENGAYMIYHNAPQETFRVLDFFGAPFDGFETYDSHRDAVIAILRRFIPEWSKAVQHLKEISQPTAFSQEWEEEARQQAKLDRALSDDLILTEEVLDTNYVHRLIMDAQKGVV